MLSDDQIIKMVRKGRIEMFRELIVTYQARVLKLCAGILGNRDDAQDAAQEAFIRMYQNLSQIQKNDSFWPWARRIAINVCLKKLAASKVCDDIDEYADRLAIPEDSIPEEVFKRMKSAEVKQFVAELPAIYRTIIILRYSEELSINEIVDATGETKTTVHMRLHRAKKLLREKMVAICL